MTCVLPADMSCCGEWAEYPVELRASALTAASETLWRLTGRVFAMVPLSTAFTPEEVTELESLGYTDDCSAILRPCKQHCGSACDTCGWPGDPYGAGWYTPWVPYLDAGVWFNASCGTCGDTCQCGAGLDVLELPGPVAQVNTVWIDGAVFEAWALYNANMLVRTDGEQWPACQNLDRDLTEDGTWGVDYTRGIPWPVGGRRAVGALACEFARLCSGDKRCRIPANVVSVTRDGVSYDLDPTTYYENGLTSLPEVDLFVSSVNPKHIARPFGVYTPQTIRRDGYVRRQPGEVTP